MALRRPTVRSRSAPRKHFGFFQFGLKSRVWDRLGNDWSRFSEVLRRSAPHDASLLLAQRATERVPFRNSVWCARANRLSCRPNDFDEAESPLRMRSLAAFELAQ